MKLEWMGEHRDVVEALIRYCNVYAAVYKPEQFSYKGVSYSFAQMQVLEYLLENEERKENMSTIASRLGITRSHFTKIANRLVAKGLLTKSPMQGNRKELQLGVNDFGRELYDDYSKKVLKYHFQPMFSSLDEIPAEYRKYIRAALLGSHGEGSCEHDKEE